MSAYRQTGTMPQMLRDAPSLPKGLGQLWGYFGELNASRQIGMSGPQRITFLDIDAWQRVCRVILAPWELKALRKADDAFLADYAERNRSAARD